MSDLHVADRGGWSTRVGWKVHRLTMKELCHSNETWPALNSAFPDTNCIVSFQINPHWISNSRLWKLVQNLFSFLIFHCHILWCILPCAAVWWSIIIPTLLMGKISFGHLYANPEMPTSTFLPYFVRWSAQLKGQIRQWTFSKFPPKYVLIFFFFFFFFF